MMNNNIRRYYNNNQVNYSKGVSTTSHRKLGGNRNTKNGGTGSILISGIFTAK